MSALPFIILTIVTAGPLALLIFGWPRKTDDGYPHQCIEREEP